MQNKKLLASEEEKKKLQTLVTSLGCSYEQLKASCTKQIGKDLIQKLASTITQKIVNQRMVEQKAVCTSLRVNK